MAAREIASPQILPIRQQAENSRMDSSGVLDRGEVADRGVALEGAEESPFKMTLGCSGNSCSVPDFGSIVDWI